MKTLRGVLGTILCLYALGFVVAHCAGCTPADKLTIENAAAVSQYDAGLVECKRAAKKAKDFDTYEACENRITRAYCASSMALRKEWARCRELGVSP